MTLQEVSTEAVEEWAAHPVTEVLRDNLGLLLSRWRKSLSEQFLSGPTNDPDWHSKLEQGRQRYQGYQTLYDDLFGNGAAEQAADINALIERMSNE